MRGRMAWSIGLLTAFGVLAGCGVTSNPRRLPFLIPPGDVTQTHAKPGGRGYFADFDPKAKRLEVRPGDVSLPVRGQQVLIATVYDADDTPRRKRRVEWIIEGPGTIIEVDESGVFSGRGYKVDNKYAVSYTDYFEHVVDRGNDNPDDDFAIRPGQTWCVVSSAVQGLTTVTAYAPEIHDWDKNRVFTKLNFIDCDWKFPPTAKARAGGEVSLTTVARTFSDKAPLAGYQVRYKLLDDAENSVFRLTSQGGENTKSTTTADVTTDAAGRATVTLAQPKARRGSSRVSVEVVKADPKKPDAEPVVIARGETTVEWQAADLGLTVTAPRNVPVGKDFTVQLAVANNSDISMKESAVSASFPPEIEVLNLDPEPARRDGRQYYWNVAALPSGSQKLLTVTARIPRPGRVEVSGSLRAGEGGKSDASAIVTASDAKLGLELTAPAQAVVGERLDAKIVMTNPGGIAAKRVRVTVEYPDGLRGPPGQAPGRFETTIDVLAPGETKTVTAPLTPERAGRFTVKAAAVSEGDILAPEQRAEIDVGQPKLKADIVGPTQVFVGQEATWRVRVANGGTLPVGNTILRVNLPANVDFKSATAPGKLLGRDVVFDLGTAPPNEQGSFDITVVPTSAGGERLTASATAEPLRQGPNNEFKTVGMTKGAGLEAQASASFEALGVSGLRVDVTDSSDPIDVGGALTYTIKVRNAGTASAPNVEVKAFLPKQVRPVRFRGPADAVIDRNTVKFKPLETLRAGGTATYTVEAEAVEPGDGRFEASVESASMAKPLTAQESTRVLPKAGSVGQPAPVGPKPKREL